jgi:hypothetical protein
MGKSKDLATRVGIDDNADATAITITSQENVGIGTASPSNYGAAYTSLGVSGSSASAIEGFVGSNLVGYLQAYNTAVLVGSKTNVPLKLVTNDTIQMTIDGSGRVTMPNQPSFNVRGAAAWTTTTQGNNTTFSHNTVAFNVGNHFNTSNNRFVAPVAGRYLFVTNAYVRLESNDDDTNHAYIYIHKNGAAYNNAYAIFGYVNNGDADQTQNVSVVMDMAVNDYATLSFNAASGSMSYYGNGTTFSGFLIG